MASQEDINAAWEQASAVPGKDRDIWRRDEEGNLIRYGSYGTQEEYGWEIEYRHPLSMGGSESSQNLRALHWADKRKKSESTV